MMRRSAWVYRCVAILALLAWAQAAPASIQAKAEALVRAAALDKTRVAMMAIDLKSGEQIIRFNANEPMIPASNLKLITTAAALEMLGRDFTFQTLLQVLMPTDWQQGYNPQEVTLPDLVVRGSGDPSFGDPRVLSRFNMDVEDLVNKWADAVKATGIHHFGRLFIDDRIFERLDVHPDWPENQLDRWYCAPVSGLNFHTNCIDVFPEPARQLESPRIRISPVAGFVSTLNRAKTDLKNDSFWISRKPETNDLTFFGKVKFARVTPVSITMYKPPVFFGQLLAERLLERGVTVDEVVLPAMDQMVPQGQTIHLVQSTLPLVLARCNKDSQNLYAEALLKRIGHEETGAPGGWDNGSAAARIFMRKVLGGRAAVVDIADGSGMSRNNRVTARVLVDLLAFMHQSEHYETFRDSLALSGQDGTLRDRPIVQAPSVIHGKSGYIEGVSSLCGYLVIPTTGNSEPRVIAFSLLFNDFQAPVYNHHMKALQDQILRMMEEDLASLYRAELGG